MSEPEIAAWFSGLNPRRRSALRALMHNAPAHEAWRVPGWDRVCQSLRKQGLLRWVVERKGFQLTERGVAVRDWLRRN